MGVSEQRYRSLVEATAAIVWNTSASGELEADQPGWTEFTGQSFEQFRGWGWLEAIHPEDQPGTARAWSHAVEARTPYRVEHRLRHRDGEYRDMSVRAVPLLADDGSLREWVGVHTDITERVRIERALRQSRERLVAAMAASGTGTFRWDMRSGAVEEDEQLDRLFGLPRGQTIRSVEQFLAQVYPEDRPEVIRRCERCLSEGVDFLMEFRVVWPDGSIHWLDDRGRTSLDDRGEPLYMIGACVDITERKRAEERLAHQATHDALTGMPNRTLLNGQIERRIASARSEDTPFALLLLDLDRFKEINDTFGHHHGDAVLREMNPRFRDAVRESDMVARLGGDEFGILLAGEDRAGAARVAERIITSMERSIDVEGQVLEVGVSIGIALYPEHGRDAVTLMRLADVAMYAAKRARVGRAVFAADVDVVNPRRLTLVSELRQAIEGEQLLLHYQSKIDLRTRRVSGAEALTRWIHPREGMMPPGDFIPLAERTGLIRPLTLWALNAASLQCRAWRETGLDLNVSVNLAPESLQDDGLVETVVRLMEGSGTSSPWLTLEVTEGAMMEDPARAKAVLGALHEMGVRISIDDFGTGYSSLAYLKELPVDEVKVDRSFIKKMASDKGDACIVRAVIDLGHNLGLRVVAEGVEDQESLDLLTSWGCDLAQGYFFSPPLPAEGFLRHVGTPIVGPAPSRVGGAAPWGPVRSRAGTSA